MNTATAPTNSASRNSLVREDLEVLFEETVDLANCLKRKARRTHRGEQLSPSGRILLQSLHLKGPQTVPALAHVRSTSRQNIQTLVDRLATAGYVEFVANPGHRRSDFVQLTQAGETMLASANEREAGLLESLLPHATSAEVRGAAELLRKLRLQMGGQRKRRKHRRVEAAAEPEHEIIVATTDTASAPELRSEPEFPVNLL